MPNAIVMTGYGPPEVLTRTGVPLREPGAGQIRIKVKAAGISPTDLALRGRVRTLGAVDAARPAARGSGGGGRG
jgi:NADPH:quinone reductase-like Zn-dependent oxidoreductase